MAITLHNSNQFAGSTAVGVDFNGPAFRVASVAERFILLVVGYRSNTGSILNARWQPGGNPTGQVSMTFLGKITHPTQTVSIEFWGLNAPTINTAINSRIVFQHSQAISVSGFGGCFTGVDQTTPYDGYVTGTEQATAIGLNNANGFASTSNITTTMAAVTTVVNQYVVQGAAWNNFTGTERHNPAAGHEWMGSRAGGSNPNSLQTTVQTIKATTTSTSTNDALTFNTGLNTIGWVITALPLNPSTTVSPQFITPPTVATTTSGTPVSPISTTSTVVAGNLFNTTNTPGFFYGPVNMQQITSAAPTRASTVAANSFTYTGTQPANNGIGTRIQESATYGDATTNVATQNFVLPSIIATNDIAIVTVNSFLIVAQPTIAGFTAVNAGVQNNASGPRTAFRTDMFYRRILSGDTIAGGGNEASRTFTITAAASSMPIHAATQIYRGAVTSGSPIDASTTATGTSLGSGSTATAGTITTTGLNRTIVTAFGSNVPIGTVREAAAAAWSRRGSYFGLSWGDDSKATAGVTTPAIYVPNPSAAVDWNAITAALIPASGNTTYNVTLTVADQWAAARASVSTQTTFDPTLTVADQWAAGRAVLTSTETYNRTLTVAAQWAGGRAVLTTEIQYHRTLTVAAQWSVGRAVLTHTETYNRTLTVNPQWANGRASVTGAIQGVHHYDKRIPAIAGTATSVTSTSLTDLSASFTASMVGSVVVVGSLTTSTQITSVSATTLTFTSGWVGGVTPVAGPYEVATSAGPYWAASRAVLTRQVMYDPTLTVTAAWGASRAVLTRRVTFNRTLTVAAAWASSRATVATTETYHVTLTVAAQWGAGRAVLTGIKLSASSGIPFGTFPVLWLYTASSYTGCAIYFEAQLKSGDTNAVAAQLNDLGVQGAVANPAATGIGTLVVVSQIQTSAPHSTYQRVRSGDISSALIDGHIYRADMNKLSSTVPMTMVDAFVEAISP